MSSDTLCDTGKEPISFRLGTISEDNPFGMPDASLDSVSCFAFTLFFFADVVLACDFLLVFSGFAVLCAVDFNLVDGKRTVVGAGTM